MQKIFFILLLTISGLFFACKDTNSTASGTNTTGTESPKIDENIGNSTDSKSEKVKDDDITVYTWVDNLRLRSEPDTNSEVVKELKEGDALTFLGEKTDFTKKVNLRGKVYDEPWLKVRTEDDITGWVFGGAVRFYKPSVDKAPSPYDKCFTYLSKNNFAKFQECTNGIQNQQIRKDTRFLKEGNDGYELHLLSGKMVKLNYEIRDSTDFSKLEYRYYMPQMGYFVARADYHEGGEYLLINDKSGKQIPIWGYPKTSSDARHLVSTNNSSEPSKHPNGIQVLSFTENGLETVFEQETSEEYLPSLPKWLDEKTWLLWLGPFVVLLIVLFLVGRFIKQQSQITPEENGFLEDDRLEGNNTDTTSNESETA